MIRQIRLGLWLALLLGAVAAIAGNLNRTAVPVADPDGDVAEAPRFLVPVPVDRLAAVELVRRGQIYRFERDDAGYWFLHAHQHAAVQAKHGHEADPPETSRIAQGLEMFGRTRVERVVGRADIDDRRFGTATPTVIVNLFERDAVRPIRRLVAGDLAPDGFARYLKITEEAEIVTIPDYQIQTLLDLLEPSGIIAPVQGG
jgi:hypothetical protein